MNQPLVSVICACYNQSRYVIESLESVKNQTYKNLEIIIWDDASKDDSVKIIEEWISDHSDLNIQFIKNRENRGICKSLNTAQNQSTGKYIQLLALDDILYPDKITRHVEILEKSAENEVLVFSEADLMDDLSKKYQNKFLAFHKNYLSLKSGNFYDDLMAANFIPGMSILFKSESLKKIGPWDENLLYEDYDMLLRLSKKYEFIFDEKTTVAYRLHDQNTHKVLSSKMYKSQYLLRLKHINYDKTVNRFLKDYIIKSYRNKTLQGEQIEYFNTIPCKNFRDRWLLKNKNHFLFGILEKIIGIKDILFYGK